jgi:neutral ceramidase
MVIWLSLAMLSHDAVADSRSAAAMQAGVARIDITPPLELQASLGGYGDRMSAPAEGIHDRLFAKAIVFQQGSRRFALVTADILGFPPYFKDTVIERLQEEGWSHHQVMLLPSHSHTAIDMMQIHPKNKLPIPQLGLFHRKLFELTRDRIVSVIQQACQELHVVRIGSSSVQLDGWNANRRSSDGVVDRDLTITRIDTDTGKSLAVLVHWTAHPTIMSADDMWYSGGWPGHLQRTLEALLGSSATVMYYNGAEGDQRPVARQHSGNSRWEKAERYGRELAIKCHRVWQKIDAISDGPFAFHSEVIELPEPLAHPDFMQTGGSEYGLNDAVFSKLLATIVPATTRSVSLRLGDLLIVGVPGEMTAKLGHEIEVAASQITDARHVVIGGLANEWISYILTPEEYTAGGYESSVSFYGPTLGPVIRDGAVAGVRRLQP